MPRPVAVFYHEDCLLHDTGSQHPETADRLIVTRRALLESAISSQLHWFKPEPAAVRWIESIHSPEYRQYIEESCLSGKHFADMGDTVICHDSYHAALLSAGAAIGCVDAVMKEGYKCAFSLTRPPGHHASTEKAMGFCLFNNVAIAAQYAETAYDLERICIFDWDVHHGNGTQDIFYGSPSVLFCSIHQLPLWPETGESFETGTKAGKGLTVNIPVPGGADIDLYEDVFREEIKPAVEAFQPQLFLISAGFDAHHMDPLADIRLTTEDYRLLTQWITDLADRFAHGRVVSLLEGGYNLDVLPASVIQHVNVLAGT